VDSYLDIPRWDPMAVLRGPAKFLAGEARHPFYSYRRAIERMLRRADATTCATPEQAAVMSPLCANVHPIVDFQSDLVVQMKENYEAGSPFHLVWEGMATNVKWFGEIGSALTEVHRRHPLVLHVIAPLEYREFVQRFWRRQTSRIAARHFENVKVYEWSEKMVSIIATSCDVAVIPLPLDRPYQRGKSENKLISFWSMGLPTVTSATPAYTRAMREAGQDLTCSSQREWIERLLHLIDHEEARRAAGEAGRTHAEGRYSNERLMEAWDRVFGSLTP
jgi:glycosyltransferase involved in cell wall biosynthesis